MYFPCLGSHLAKVDSGLKTKSVISETERDSLNVLSCGTKGDNEDNKNLFLLYGIRLVKISIILEFREPSNLREEVIEDTP
mmetsp:Transcript_22177/g.24627  ORF Transcript_22177/g.24627 Transcript_22177/m.24627 type:complete len:81 (-) Transcript_22177:421-663(-)